MTHDPCCPLGDAATTDCAVCTAIAAARAQEIEARNRIWHQNMPRVARRNYEEGYRDAINGLPNRHDQ